MEQKSITLTTVGDGVAVEEFDHALLDVLNNVLDVNTDPKAKREIKLTFTFKPDDGRELVDVVVKCETKLAASRPRKSAVYVGKVNGMPVAVENDPRQGGLFDQPKGGTH